MKTKKHSCDAVVRADDWAMSGFRKTGDKWKCSCGSRWVFQEDEAEGGGWHARYWKERATQKGARHE